MTLLEFSGQVLGGVVCWVSESVERFVVMYKFGKHLTVGE
jgi:hypothetical protein